MISKLLIAVMVSVVAVAGHAADLELVRVWPEKLLYAPKETARITVTLRNAGTTEQRADLIVTLVTDLATERELLRRSVTVPAGTNAEVDVNARLREDFGHEVRAVLMRQGQEVSRAREVFTVAEQAPLVSQYAFWAPLAGTDKDLRERVVPMFRRNYLTMLEIYDWAPSDFSDFTPSTEDWWGGTKQVPLQQVRHEDLCHGSP